MIRAVWRAFVPIGILALTGADPGLAAGAAREPAPLLARLQALQRAYQIPAYGLALVSADEVLHAQVSGQADVARGREADRATMFRVGSVTKTVTALAAMSLVADRQLSLQARVREHVPEVPLHNRWAATHPLRLVHLLEHTAGLTDLSRAEFDHNVPLPLAAALARTAAERIVRWPAGLHAEYSNAGYGLAGRVLERSAGMSYEALVQARVLAPLGMHDSGFELDARTRRRLALGYQEDGRTPIAYWHTIFRPFGGLNTSVSDMARLVRFLLGQGQIDGRRLLAPESIARMETPSTTLAARAGLAYGYGLGIDQWHHAGFLFHGHGGDGDGYLARYGYCREIGIGYFVVINAFNKPAMKAVQDAIEAWITAARTPAPAPRVELSAAELGRYAGLYRAVTWRFPWAAPASEQEASAIRVLVDKGRLMTLRGTGTARALLPAGAAFFRRSDETRATSAFVRGPDGALYLQGDMGSYRRVEPP